MVSQDWKEQAKQQIKEWHIKNQLHQDNPKALQQEIARVINNRLSPPYFDYIHRVYEALTNAVATAPDNIRFLHLGSEWSFSALEITQYYRPLHVTAVDDWGRFYWTARNVLEQNATLFDGVNIPAPWEFSMKQHREAFDCIFISSPAPTDNTWYMRSILAFQALQCVRPGGAAIIQLNKAPGGMSAQDIRAVMESAGFSHITPLSRATLPLDSWEEAPISCVLGHSKQSCAHDTIRQSLIRRGQHREGLIQRGVHHIPPTAFPALEEGLARQALEFFPSRLTLNSDGRCNLRCAFCNWPDMLLNSRMSEILEEEIIANISQFHNITLAGGECLLHPLFYKMLDYAVQHVHPQMTMISNMTVGSARTRELIVRGVSHLSCSIDAATAETYQKLRIGGNFAVLTRNLQELAVLRSQISDCRLNSVTLNFIVNGFNYHEITRFAQFAEDTGADGVHYTNLNYRYSPRTSSSIQLDYTNDEQMHTILQQFISSGAFCQQHGIQLSISLVHDVIRQRRPDIYKLYHKELESALHQYSDTRQENLQAGTMPCLAPFTDLAFYPRNAVCFCCWSTPKYHAIPMDPELGIAAAFNHPLYQEARSHFYEGKFEAVCTTSCPLYMRFLKNKNR